MINEQRPDPQATELAREITVREMDPQLDPGAQQSCDMAPGGKKTTAVVRTSTLHFLTNGCDVIQTRPSQADELSRSCQKSDQCHEAD
jgi:hypothetical protein